MKYFLLIAFMTMLVSVNAQETVKNDSLPKMVIVVDGIEEIKGDLMIGLYNSSDTHMKKTSYGFKVKITEKTMEVRANGVAPGEYSIAVYQDENGNNKLDAGLFGIPTEKYGFSKNVKGFMGAPSYEKTKISFPKQKVVRININ